MIGEVSVIQVLTLIKLRMYRYNNNEIKIRSRYSHGYSVPFPLQDDIFVLIVHIMVEVGKQQ